MGTNPVWSKGWTVSVRPVSANYPSMDLRIHGRYRAWTLAATLTDKDHEPCRDLDRKVAGRSGKVCPFASIAACLDAGVSFISSLDLRPWTGPAFIQLTEIVYLHGQRQ